MTEPFRPVTKRADRPFHPETYRFQINHLELPHELGLRARAAAIKFGMKNQPFVIACVEYALDHMDD